MDFPGNDNNPGVNQSDDSLNQGYEKQNPGELKAGNSASDLGAQEYTKQPASKDVKNPDSVANPDDSDTYDDSNAGQRGAGSGDARPDEVPFEDNRPKEFPSTDRN